MSDKYSRPIATRLLLVALFALGLIYAVSHIPKPGDSHEHHDVHGDEMHVEDAHEQGSGH